MLQGKVDYYRIQNYEQLLDLAALALSGIASGAEFKAQMQRFVKKGLHDNALGKPGFDVCLANIVNKFFNEMKST